MLPEPLPHPLVFNRTFAKRTCLQHLPLSSFCFGWVSKYVGELSPTEHARLQLCLERGTQGHFGIQVPILWCLNLPHRLEGPSHELHDT